MQDWSCLYRAGDIPQSPPVWSVVASSSGAVLQAASLGFAALPKTKSSESRHLHPVLIKPSYTASLCALPMAPCLFLCQSERPVHCADCTRLCSETSAPAALQALHDGPACYSFLKRWKLSVYFSLRFQVSSSSNSHQNPCVCLGALQPVPRKLHALAAED